MNIRLIAPLLLIALPALLEAQETSFLEKFSLAADRDAALKELIPGTDDYYYYHALHLQNQGKKEEMEAIAKEWAERFPDNNPRRNEIQNRQAPLNYAGIQPGHGPICGRGLAFSTSISVLRRTPCPTLP